MTVKECLEQFTFHCTYEKNLSKKTLSAYKSDFTQFMNFINEKTGDSQSDISNLDKALIRQYVEFLVSSYKVKTAKRKIASLKSFLNYLEFEDIIAVNPFRKLRIKLKVPKTLPNVLTLSEVKRILTSAYNFKNSMINSSHYTYTSCCRDIAILELLFGTGIRISELCSLKHNQIDLKSNHIIVYGKGAKERIIHICSKEIIQSLRNFDIAIAKNHPNRTYFFLNRLDNNISAQSVRFMINRYVKLAKIDKKITPHTFRHTFATLLLEEGVDIKYIQHFLGHSSINTTQIYTHVNRKSQKKILNSKHPRRKFSMSKEVLNE